MERLHVPGLPGVLMSLQTLSWPVGVSFVLRGMAVDSHLAFRQPERQPQPLETGLDSWCPLGHAPSFSLLHPPYL